MEGVSSSAPSSPSKQARKEPLPLRAIGFCGVDDSVDPQELVSLSKLPEFEYAEWGILFRSEREGKSRFASMKWLERLIETARSQNVRLNLAAHLCSSRVVEVLDGNADFVKQLCRLGFQRVQINATKVNGVERALSAADSATLKKMALTVPELEWIIQKNEETMPLWEPFTTDDSPPPNISFLFDDSAGKGITRIVFPSPFGSIPCGYAGGIGPTNIDTILTAMSNSEGPHLSSKATWIDMESSLRILIEGQDRFQLKSVKTCMAKANDLAKSKLIKFVE